MQILILALAIKGFIRSMGFIVLIVVIIAAIIGWIRDKIG